MNKSAFFEIDNLTATFEVDNMRKKTLTLYQGADKSFSLWIVKDDGNPVDMTGATDIKVNLPKESGVLSLDCTATDQPGGGKIDTSIALADASLLKAAERQSVEVEYIKSTKKEVFLMEESLYVVERLS